MVSIGMEPGISVARLTLHVSEEWGRASEGLWKKSQYGELKGGKSHLSGAPLSQCGDGRGISLVEFETI
jgi:hypothetical protein